MRTILSTVTTFAAAMLLMSTEAQASHNSPLSEAACAYRDAVLHFGQEVVADHRLTHFERRVAPPLVNASNRFYVSAQHPHQLQYLRSAWLEIALMHRQVELVLFSHPGCPVYVAMYPCWQEVLCAYNDLAAQLASLGCHTPDHGHGHGHATQYPEPAYGYPSVGYQPGASLPPAIQSYRYRNEPIRSYRYGNLGHSVSPPSSQPALSPSERQSLEREQQIERVISRRQLEMGQLGAKLSRRVD